MPSTGAGVLREILVIQENSPDPVVVTSLTRVTTVATAITAVPHGYTSGDFVNIAGASIAAWNAKFKITVTGPSSFTFPVVGTLTTPATGTITATYFSDAQGGRQIGWDDVATVWAELVPVRAFERAQLAALQVQLDYRFRIHARGDLTPKMRALWTPQWPPGQTAKTLEIHGVLPDGDGRQWTVLDCGAAA